MQSPPANEIYSAARICEFLRQEYETPFMIFGRIDTRSCGARSVIPELSHTPNGYSELWCALGDTGAVVRARG